MAFVKKHGQSFFWDFVVGATIFTIMIILFLKYNNMFDKEGDSMATAVEEAKVVAESLVTAGYPNNWTQDDVGKIGISNGKGRIVQGKLDSFININADDYDNSRFLLSITHDYIIFFKDKNNNIVEMPTDNGTITAVGKPGYSPDNIRQQEELKDLAKVERYVIYNSEIVRMIVYVWSTQ